MGTNRDHLIGLLASRMEQIEARFGGVQKGVERRKISQWDPRAPSELKRTAMQGGDRMDLHGYASHYAQYLLPLVQRGGKDMIFVELGILRGSGLAMLCELFPKARRIIGLDVDTSHFNDHRPNLEERGAFRRRQPEIHAFDELDPDASRRLADIMNGDQVDVFIHDALHYDAAILTTIRHAQLHFRRSFRCFIEDNSTVSGVIARTYGERFAVAGHGRLTVLWRD